MKITKNEIMMAFSFLIAYIAFALPYGYMQTYLDYIGYSVVERGYIIAGHAIVAILLQFVVGYLCDKYSTDKKVFDIGFILLTLFTVLLFQFTSKEFYIHLLFISIVGGLVRCIMQLQETWCLETDDTCKNHFGPLRSLGSIGWMIGNTFGAFVIQQYGYNMLGIVFGVLGICNILLSLFMNDAIKEKKKDHTAIKLDDVKTLLHNKKYIIIVSIFFVVNIIAAADQFTIVDKMLLLKAKEDLIGLRFTLQGMSEIPLFLLGTILLKKFGDFKLMIFGIIVYIIKFILYAFASSPEAMLIIALLQGLSYPLIMITSKTLVDNVTPKVIRASGQSIAGAFYGGLSLLITPIIAGYLVSNIGIDSTLLLVGGCGLIPIILAIIYKRL